MGFQEQYEEIRGIIEKAIREEIDFQESEGSLLYVRPVSDEEFKQLCSEAEWEVHRITLGAFLDGTGSIDEHAKPQYEPGNRNIMLNNLIRSIAQEELGKAAKRKREGEAE